MHLFPRLSLKCEIIDNLKMSGMLVTNHKRQKYNYHVQSLNI